MDCGEGKMSLTGAYQFPEFFEQTSLVLKRIPLLIRNIQTSLFLNCMHRGIDGSSENFGERLIISISKSPVLPANFEFW